MSMLIIIDALILNSIAREGKAYILPRHNLTSHGYMNRKNILNFAVATALLLPVQAFAYDSSILKAGIGLLNAKTSSSYSNSARLEDGYAGRISLTKLFTPFIGVELEGEFAFSRMKSPVAKLNKKKVHALPLSGLVQLRLPIKSIVVPYVGIGGTYRTVINNPASIKIKSAVGLAYQAGVDLFILENIGINLDTKWSTIKHSVRDSSVSPNRFRMKLSTMVTTLGVAVPF
jgi:outer membrane protein W